MDLDLQLGYWSAGSRTYHHTAPINALYGLHEALLMLREEGLERAWERHRRNHLALAAGLRRHGTRARSSTSVIACRSSTWSSSPKGSTTPPPAPGCSERVRHRDRRRPGGAGRQGVARRTDGLREPRRQRVRVPAGAGVGPRRTGPSRSAGASRDGRSPSVRPIARSAVEVVRYERSRPWPAHMSIMNGLGLRRRTPCRLRTPGR